MSEQPCLVGTPAEMEAARAALDKALGFPRRGRQVGGGIHAACPEAWDGNGDCPPGWTRSASEVLVDDDGAAYLPLHGVEAIKPEGLAKLTGRERVLVSRAPRLADVAAIKLRQVERLERT